jgi:hypothetical protein
LVFGYPDSGGVVVEERGGGVEVQVLRPGAVEGGFFGVVGCGEDVGV